MKLTEEQKDRITDEWARLDFDPYDDDTALYLAKKVVPDLEKIDIVGLFHKYCVDTGRYEMWDESEDAYAHGGTTPTAWKRFLNWLNEEI